MADKKQNTIHAAVGIFGGTFDPIHFGHLRTALEVQQQFNLDSVQLIPSYQPVHRDAPMASPEQRLTMLKLATERESRLAVNDCEIIRKGPSYTIDTLDFLQTQFPNTALCLILGIDAFLGFKQWHRFENILSKCHLIIVHRPNYQIKDSLQLTQLPHGNLVNDKESIRKNLSGNILLQPVTHLEISASEIRQQFSMQQNPRYLLPNKVLQYIQENGIYGCKHL